MIVFEIILSTVAGLITVAAFLIAVLAIVVIGPGKQNRGGSGIRHENLQRGLTIIMAAVLSAGLTVACHASTVSVYNLDIDANGTSIAPVGTVTIVSNTKNDTLTYTFSLTNSSNLTEIFLDAGPGGTAKHDLGSTTNSLGTFTDSFAAKGNKFSITFNGTDVADFTRGSTAIIFAGVETTKGLFADGTPIGEPSNPPTTDPTATPLPAALPLFATGLAGLGLLGWRRRRKARTGA